MTRLVLKLYDFMRSRPGAGIFSFLLLTAVLAALVMRVEYKEDISDFLPLDGSHDTELGVFQKITGADKLFAVFSYADSAATDVDAMTRAVDDFTQYVRETDTLHITGNITSEVDLDAVTGITDFVYENIPYFLTDEDYARMDSLLDSPDFVEEQLSRDKLMLMLPSGGLIAGSVGRDPLGLFSPALEALQAGTVSIDYEMYDGYIFSPDMTKAFVMITSPFGGSETENNARITDLLEKAAKKTADAYEGMDIHIIGAPAIAVGNARRIKADSVLSVACAMALILALLFFSFRNVRNLLLIALAICWGWLFGFGCLSIVHHDISVIVLGISSVVLGIAVNYPLHLIAHFRHTPDKRTAVREIVAPLVVGNITTVGAFLALVPLKSAAMRDLGLFSSFMLAGTIIFVLVWLPHMAFVPAGKKAAENPAAAAPTVPWRHYRSRKHVFWGAAILTVVLGYFSLGTAFDADMAGINYMTEAQRVDMAYFQSVMKGERTGVKVYAVCTAPSLDAALEMNDSVQGFFRGMAEDGEINGVLSCNRFLTSEGRQHQRLEKWNSFVMKRGYAIKEELSLRGKEQGFADGSFDAFLGILDEPYTLQPQDFFAPVAESVAGGFISENKDGGYNVASVLDSDTDKAESLIEKLRSSGLHAFDAAGMNSAIANTLSDDFNYIGWACGLIVFFFLWMSMGSLELAVLSFIPMAVSWVWILGLMALFGMHFNIVNIILATFIFGQGDDYTIFMTEGSCYEYACRRRILSSYKSSIILSALIMFIGIGSLILARHPALHSLAEVTIVGMLSVVVTAYILPPMIFGWMTSGRGGYRTRPLSLVPMAVMACCFTVFIVQLATVYVLGFALFVLTGKNARRQMFFRRYVQRLYAFDFKHICGVGFRVENESKEDFTRPAVIVANHQSMLDAAVFMALSPRLVLVSNGKPAANFLVGRIYEWMGFVTLSGNGEKDLEKLGERVADGYSIVVFPEGERNPESSITRFHKGAFYMASRLGLDIVPVILHGLNAVLPRNSISVFRGQITVSVEKRIPHSARSVDYAETTKVIHRYFHQRYGEIRREIETAPYFKAFVLDRYRYKGYEVMRSVSGRLKTYNCFTKWIDGKNSGGDVAVADDGYGEFALLYALVHPTAAVTAVLSDSDKAVILKYSAEGVVPNLRVAEDVPFARGAATMVCLVEPDGETRKKYAGYNTVTITDKSI